MTFNAASENEQSSIINQGEGGSDFASGLGCLPTEERLTQERAELIEIYIKMRQGMEAFEVQAEE